MGFEENSEQDTGHKIQEKESEHAHTETSHSLLEHTLWHTHTHTHTHTQNVISLCTRRLSNFSLLVSAIVSLQDRFDFCSVVSEQPGKWLKCPWSCQILSLHVACQYFVYFESECHTTKSSVPFRQDTSYRFMSLFQMHKFSSWIKLI